MAAQRLGGGRAHGGRPGVGRVGPGLLKRLGGRIPRFKPLKVLTVGAFGVALVGIVANAMVFQRGHHPSPLFGLGRSVDGAPDQAGQRAAAAAAEPAATAPVPVERTGTIPQAPAADPAPLPAAAASKPAVPVRHAAKTHRDEVAKAKPGEAPAAAHPRPGRPVTARAKAGAKPDIGAEAKLGSKADPLGKLIAGAVHAAKTDKAASAPASHGAAKTEHKPVSAGTAPDHPAKAADAAPAHHRLAAAEAKPAAKAPAE